ncbi:hypothetical protein HMPREF1383_02110, partial [Enterococcus faecium V689]
FIYTKLLTLPIQLKMNILKLPKITFNAVSLYVFSILYKLLDT